MSKTTNYELEKYDDNTNCDFRFINGSLDKIDTELKKVSDKANRKEVIIKNITINGSTATWEYYGYTYDKKDIWGCNVLDANITENDVVDINFSHANIINGDLEKSLGFTQTKNGICTIFFTDRLLTKTFNATMVIHKGAI